jgi:hypothetical protein
MRCFNTLPLKPFLKTGLLAFFLVLWRFSGLSKAFFLIFRINKKYGGGN